MRINDNKDPKNPTEWRSYSHEKHFLSVPPHFLPHSCLCTSLEATFHVFDKLKLFSQKIIYSNYLPSQNTIKSLREKTSTAVLLGNEHSENERVREILGSKEL